MYDFESIPRDFNLYDTLKLTNSENQTTYLIISKSNHFENLTYKDLFYSLKNLRTKIQEDSINHLYLSNHVEKNSNLNQAMVNEIIAFLFVEHNI